MHLGIMGARAKESQEILAIFPLSPTTRLTCHRSFIQPRPEPCGHGLVLVRSLDDALGALAYHGLTTRVVQPDATARAVRPARRAAP